MVERYRVDRPRPVQVRADGSLPWSPAMEVRHDVDCTQGSQTASRTNRGGVVKHCALLLAIVPVVCAGSSAAQTTGGGAPVRDRAGDTREKSDSWQGPMGQRFWVDARGGVESIELQTFSANLNSFSAGFLPTSGTGPTASVGAGLRFGLLTVGTRGRLASFESAGNSGSWQVWTLDAEFGVRIPLDRVEPHFALAGGYSSFAGLGNAIPDLGGGIEVHGADVRFGLGVDYWVTHHLSLGIDLDEQLLAVARDGVPLGELAAAREVGTINDAKARALEASGSSFGSALAVTGGVGAHF